MSIRICFCFCMTIYYKKKSLVMMMIQALFLCFRNIQLCLEPIILKFHGPNHLVSVSIRFKRPFNRNTDVISLMLIQYIQFHTNFCQV